MHPVRALFQRHAWATRELMRWCERLDPELLRREVPGTYGTIPRTFSHLCGNEQHYLHLLTGHPAPAPMQPGEQRRLAALQEVAEENAARWRRVLDAAPDPERPTWHEVDGRRVGFTPWVVMVQCVYHGDQHRAHIGSVLGSAGVEPPDLDGWRFRTGAEHGDGPAGDWADALLLRFLDFSGWATGTVLEHCLELGDRALLATAPGTYGTLHGTLTHMIDADGAYLSLLTGAPEVLLEGSADPDTLRRCAERWRAAWRDYLETGPDHERLIEAGGNRRAQGWALALQAVHHTNDHLAHIGTILGTNGLPEPGTSVWTYGAAEGALPNTGAE
jgi:uncharacterized damage-inducible protein DinB